MQRHDAMSSWPAEDLAARVVRALEFACRCVADLSGQDTTDAPPAGAPVVPASKLVAETAMLLYAVAPVRLQEPRVGELVDEIAAQLIPHARGEAVQAALCLDPGHAFDHAAGHVLLGALGHRDERVDALLARSLASGMDFGPERLPHRRLEQHWLCRIGGWPAAVHPLRERDTLAASALGHPLDALAASRLDVYAYTHAVMYATDLGRSRPRLPRRRSLVAADALAALALAVETSDADLATEVLMTWPMLGLPWHPAAAFVFQRLADIDDRLGFLPGRSFDAVRHEAMAAGERWAHVRATCYHTVYVWAFLCAAALRPRAAPPAVPPGVRRRHGMAAPLLALLGEPAHRPPWLQALQTLDAARQAALAPLLLPLVLRRAAARGDLAGVSAALEVSLRGDLAQAPAALQAAALLQRSLCLSDTQAAATGAAAAAPAQSSSPRNSRRSIAFAIAR